MKVLLFQRGTRGAQVVEGLRKHGEDMVLRTREVPEDLPQIVDDPGEFIQMPEDFEPDLILDYLYQNELSQYLVEEASNRGIPVVVPGRKVQGAVSPKTCCTLSLAGFGGEKSDALKQYAGRFGVPDIELVLDGDGKVKEVKVHRGAPCGSTWKAAREVIGLDVDEAYNRFGLTVQYSCRAPTGYDAVLLRKPPLHIAADAHGEAFKKAVSRARTS